MKVYALYVKDTYDGLYRLHSVHKTMDGATEKMRKDYKDHDACIYELPLYD